MYGSGGLDLSKTRWHFEVGRFILYTYPPQGLATTCLKGTPKPSGKFDICVEANSPSHQRTQLSRCQCAPPPISRLLHPFSLLTISAWPHRFLHTLNFCFLYGTLRRFASSILRSSIILAVGGGLPPPYHLRGFRGLSFHSRELLRDGHA